MTEILEIQRAHTEAMRKEIENSRKMFKTLTLWICKPTVKVWRSYPAKIKVTVARVNDSLINDKTMVVTSQKNQATGKETKDSRLVDLNVSNSFEIYVDPFVTYEVTVLVEEIQVYNGQHAGRTSFFSKQELCQLKEKARKLSGNLQTITYFYRNKSPEYFNDIMEKHDGMMKPYIKDLNGDPKCPINGCINGLFFMGRPHGNSSTKLPRRSPFGRRRFIIPAPRLFNCNCNLYFSDFWCHYNTHYVSVVVTKKGSKTDELCHQYLQKLDLTDNGFLELQADGGVRISTSVWIEIFYTEAIDINEEREHHGAQMKTTGVFGRGKSREFGMSKKKSCPVCNL